MHGEHPEHVGDDEDDDGPIDLFGADPFADDGPIDLFGTDTPADDGPIDLFGTDAPADDGPLDLFGPSEPRSFVPNLGKKRPYERGDASDYLARLKGQSHSGKPQGPPRMARRTLVPGRDSSLWSKVRSEETTPLPSRPAEAVVSPRRAIRALQQAKNAESNADFDAALSALAEALPAAPTDAMRREILVRQAAAFLQHRLGQVTPEQTNAPALVEARKAIEEALHTPAPANVEDHLVAAAIERLNRNYTDAARSLVQAASTLARQRQMPTNDTHERLYAEARLLLRQWRDLSQAEPLFQALAQANEALGMYISGQNE